MFNCIKRLLVNLWILSTFNNVFAAFEHYPSDPANIGTGLLSINLLHQATGIFLDPASVAEFRASNIGITWGKRFGLNMLKHRSAISAIPYKNWYFSTGTSLLGNEIYKETIWGIIIGKKLNERVIIGTGFMIYDLTIKEYGRDSSIGINVGWRIKLNEQIKWFGSWRNINSPVIGQSEDPLPQVIVTGIVFQPIKKVLSAIEWEQDTNYRGRLKFGMQYSLFSWLKIMVGHASFPSQTTAGFSFNYNRLILNYAVSSHSHLDLSQWMGLGISFH